MVKLFMKRVGIAMVVIFLAGMGTFAEEPANPSEASFQSRCTDAENLNFPKCATTPSECVSTLMKIAETGKEEYRTPFNCLFLEEPIGGKTGYDLFRLTPQTNGNQYSVWYGEAIVGGDSGPYQAVLVYEEGKETQGPFGLVYNYLGLVYKFLSGLIVAFVILMTIIGGIQMSASKGDADAYGKGKDRIIKAMVGMVLWFTASVILYTINPTFFTF